MSIATDSTPLEDPKDPEQCLVYKIYKLIATQSEAEEMAANLSAGGYGYGDAKKTLLEVINREFAAAKEKRIELSERIDYIYEVLHEGAKKARHVAGETMSEVRAKVGL